MVFTTTDRPTEQHVVVAGAGDVGSRTAQVLDDYGHDVYLIERDPATVEQVTERRRSIVIEGDATDPEVLAQAGPERAVSTAAVDDVVYPERAGSKAAVNCIQADDIRALEDVTGDLDVLDVRVDPRSPVAGKQLSEVPFPEGSHVIRRRRIRSRSNGGRLLRVETFSTVR
jgi:trk system potassium uptake protein TrkA